MKNKVIEIDDVVIGKKDDVVKYLKDSQDTETEEIIKIITVIEEKFESIDSIYVKRNWNDDLVVNYFDTDLL